MKKPFIHASAAALYIVFIVFTLHYVFSFVENQEETIIMPMAMLSLFVLSAAVMGYIFLSEPLYLLMENRKQEAVAFFAKVVGFFACYIVLFTLIVFLFPDFASIETGI